MRIRSVQARQIFDSRGMPTIEAEVLLENGVRGTGIAPSGASTGRSEAREKRDGGTEYMGKGVLTAVEGVNLEINACLAGRCVSDQTGIDMAMVELDGNSDRSRLGGNALIAVSMAAANAGARCAGVPLYRWLGGVQGAELPCPMMNVINGGAHAGNNLDIQEFMIVPQGGETFEDRMRMGMECYHALKGLLKEDGFNTAVGDEGGFAPDFKSDEQALEYLVKAIKHAGYHPGGDIFLALDCAAGEWRREKDYFLPKSRLEMSGDALMARYRALKDRFPILSIEDPFGDEDFEAFADITRKIGGDTMIVGDDLFTTNTNRLEWGIQADAANAILVKPNQIGTLTETFDAIRLARRAGYKVILSHRSGETEDTAIADIAVAVNADYIKSGAPARSERVAKYNRLLKIERELLGTQC
ncbi:MAG: phosphopyruvate hydratase [Clostridia bacterium]|nr:phosphopyruvate hydratase [Clostridia bacterium]